MEHICNYCDLQDVCKEKFVEQTGKLCLNRDINIRIQKDNENLRSPKFISES